MATAKTTYSWLSFNLQTALAGTLVGLPDSDTDSENIGKKTGILRRTSSNSYTRYTVTIDGDDYYIGESGLVVSCSDPSKVGTNKYLKMCIVKLAATSGSQQSLTRGEEAGYKSTISLANLEVRDTFAVYALQSLLSHCEGNPIYYDDANILSVCAASYRWAQGMMQASADARALIKNDDGASGGTGGSPEENPPRNKVDVTDGTATEKLLSNLVAAIDDLTIATKKLWGEGLPVVGSDKEDALPVKVESDTTVKELPEVSISKMLSVLIHHREC